MSKLNKLQKFSELSSFPDVIEYTQENAKVKLQTLIKTYEHVVLELACGHGEYTLELAKRYPKTLFIGIDIQGERLWFGAKEAQEKKLENAIFFRAFIDHIEEYFPEQSVDEIWITFPDPFLKKSKENKRLTSPQFLRKYAQIVKNNHCIHLKTDSVELYTFTKEQISFHGKLIHDVTDVDHALREITNLDIQTKFEKKWRKKGKVICYIQFMLI